MLLILFGKIGTGKSTLSENIANELGFELIRFDDIMWMVFDKDKMYGDNDEFLLSAEEKQKVYDTMHVIAKYFLKQNKSVILESVYFKEQRKQAVNIAKSLNKKYQLIEVVCDEQEIKKRLEKRKIKNAQTPGFNLYLQYNDKHLAPSEKEESQHIVIDTTSKTIKESTSELVTLLKRA